MDSGCRRGVLAHLPGERGQSGRELEGFEMGRPDDREEPSIEGGDPRDPEALGSCNHGCIDRAQGRSHHHATRSILSPSPAWTGSTMRPPLAKSPRTRYEDATGVHLQARGMRRGAGRRRRGRRRAVRRRREQLSCPLSWEDLFDPLGDVGMTTVPGAWRPEVTLGPTATKPITLTCRF